MSRAHRGSTTPMDFEWSNKHGPVDQRSPFMTAVDAAQHARKRPHSVLDSPKPAAAAFTTPNRPQLREPDGRSFLFAHDSTRPLPSSIPAHVQSAWTPRTPTTDYDFSSGGETPNTPAADSEQGTPDTQLAVSMGRLNSDDTMSPKKTARRDSWFKRVFTSPSPSKDPVMHDREPTRRVYSKGAENRVAKRRSERSRKRHNVRGEADNSDAEPATPLGAPAAPVKVPQSALTSIGGFLSWVEAHPHLPSVLSFYMQLAVNTFLGCLFMYIIYSAWSGVMNDVDVESSKHASEIWVEIAFCAKQYRENRCDDRVPISEAMCGNWETCMNRDPKKLARASVTAKTFAMIFNSFVEEFSYKSMIFTAIVIFGGFNLSNWAFGLLRSQQQQQQPQPQPQHAPQHYPPQTPHRATSGTYLENTQQQQQHWQTPYQTPYEPRGFTQQQQQQQQQQPPPPPPLLHSHSLPALALPSAAQEGVGSSAREEVKTPRRRGLFR